MKLLWTTKRKNFWSMAQRYLLDEDCSHFAIEHNGMIFNQTLSGFDIDFSAEWLRENQIVHQLIPKSLFTADDLIYSIVHNHRHTSYDFIGWLYFFYRAILFKFARVKLPKVNPIDSERDVLCVGISDTIWRLRPEWFEKKPDDFDMITPNDLYKNMRNSGSFICLS